jgi:hypothetical protein
VSFCHPPYATSSRVRRSSIWSSESKRRSGEKAEQIQAELDAIKAEAAATEEPPPPPVAAENMSGADVFAC